MLDLDDLQTFLEVADAGGVNAAARRLGLSKSIVSRRLDRLEGALGVQLLTRTTRGAVLTEAGATFREHAQPAAAGLEAACEAVCPRGEVRGRLRIAAPLSFGPTHLAPVLAEFAASHPRLHIQAAYSDRFVDLVGEGFDLAVRVGYLSDSNLIARRIAPVSGQIVASPAYVEAHGAPASPEELQDHEVLMQGNESWRLTRGDRTVVVRPHGRFKADNGQALAAAAVAGAGIAALPDFLIDAHIRTGALVPLLPDHRLPVGGLYVVRPPGASPPRKVRLLIELLAQRFGRACPQPDARPANPR